MLNARQRELAVQLFDAALALPAELRADFLARECHDLEIREELESLLGFAGRPLNTLQGALRQAAGDVLRETAGEGLETGTHLGRYRILRKIGSGGFGTVYEAFDTVREETVALKTL